MRRVTVVLVAILVLQSKASKVENIDHSDIEDLLQIGGDVKINQVVKSRTGKSLGNTIEDALVNFFKSNEVTVKTPFGSTVTLNGRGLDEGEIDFKLNLNSGSNAQARKKSRIKKIIAPILIVVLLKAITLIPLAIAVLGLKTWNTLQLSFVSFVTSVVLAVWKLCSKFSDHHQPPHIIHEAIHDVHVPHVYHDSHHDQHVVHHGSYDDDHHHHHHDPWSHQYHRSDGSSQQMAYSEYVPEAKI